MEGEGQAKSALLIQSFLDAEDGQRCRMGIIVRRGGGCNEMAGFLGGSMYWGWGCLLFVPEPGIELRSKLRDYADCASHELTEQGREAWDTAVDDGGSIEVGLLGAAFDRDV